MARITNDWIDKRLSSSEVTQVDSNKIKKFGEINPAFDSYDYGDLSEENLDRIFNGENGNIPTYEERVYAIGQILFHNCPQED